ncbi:hypothetical protein UFOVP1299_77 [uncultured Caudovirales phage]|uniref:Uncharacterized protein n=1 Tax=uncultured Caudovirales phage TaxID=2100421 RepID=A0A6J5RWL2_9CAUD|nr:hypothetical protein UFOVP1299_77 [uncultured Caudovirales phage]
MSTLKVTSKHKIVNGFDFSDLDISIKYIGKINDAEWPHYLWSVNINSGEYVTFYKTGLGHAKHTCGVEGILVPEPAMVMHSLIMDSEAGDLVFEEWCDNFGFNSDSIKDHDIYTACIAIAKGLKKCFGRERIEEMRTALSDF